MDNTIIIIKRINISKIFAATMNPRVVIDEIHAGIDGNYFREKQNNKEEDALKDILSDEGDFEKFLALITSLSSMYNPAIDMPYVISSKNEEFIVVEGNRRILALKLLSKNLHMPEYDEIIANLDEEISVESLGDDDEQGSNSNDNSQDRMKNYNKIINVIKNHKIKITEIDVNFIDAADPNKESDGIRAAIFANHITGKKIGKRNWNRGRTLSIYSIMLDSLIGEEWDVKVSKIANIFFREKKDVLCYIKSAQYIECLLNWAGMDRKKFFKEKKVSSLEQQFVKKFINEYKSNYYEKILSFKLNRKFGGYELILEDNNIDRLKLSKFILDSSEILFNTRIVTEDAFNKLQNFFENRNNEPIYFNGKVVNITELTRKEVKEMGDEEFQSSDLIYKKFLKELDDFGKIDICSSSIKMDSPFICNEEYEFLRKSFLKQMTMLRIITDEKSNPTIQDLNFVSISLILRTLTEKICYLLLIDDSVFEFFKKRIKTSSDPRVNKLTHPPMENGDRYTNDFNNNCLWRASLFFRKYKEEKEFENLLTNAWKKLTNDNSVTPPWDILFSQPRWEGLSKAIHTPHFFEMSNKDGDKIIKDTYDYLYGLRILLYRII